MPKFLNLELKLPQLWRLGMALGGGILMGLTPAPVNAWPLAWIALVSLWALTLQVPPGQWRSRSLLGLAWGVGYHGLAISWIIGVHPMTWMGVPWLASLAIAVFCWIFLTLWGAVLVAIWTSAWGWLVRTLKLPLGIRLLTGVAFWCGLESLWSLGPLWWTSVSYTQSPHNLAILHLGQLSGPMMITAAIVAVNGLLAEAWMSHQRSRQGQALENRTRTKSIAALVTAVVLLLGLHLIGWNLSNRTLVAAPDTALKIGIIQGNIPNEIKLDVQGWRQALTGYTTGYNQLADQGVEAVLTPEGALPFLWSGVNLTQSSFYQAVRDRGVVAWVGAFGQKGRSITNSLFTVLGDGEIFSQYDKVKLVPLGEYIPFENILGRLIDRLSPLDAHMVPGRTGQLFETPFGRAIAGICYESAFAEHFRWQAAQGGQFILSASNDAHYSPAMTAQHHAQDVMRAIETDRWVARATNTGYSGVIDPHGRTQWLSGLNIYQIHAGTIYRRQTQTLFVRWGDWLTPVLVTLTIVLVLSSWDRR